MTRWARGLLVIALSGAVIVVSGCYQAPPPIPLPPPPVPVITGPDTAVIGELVQLVGSPEGGSWVVPNHGNPQLDPPVPDLNVSPGYYYPGPPPYYYWGDYWWPVDLGAPVNPGRAEINERGQFVAAAADVYIISYQTAGGTALHAITVTPVAVGPPTPTEIVITLPDGTLIVSGSTILIGPTGLFLFLTGATPPFTVVVTPPGVITATVIDRVILLLPVSGVPAGTYTVTIQIIGATGFSITLTIQVQIIVGPVPPVEETADAVVVISGKGGEVR